MSERLRVRIHSTARRMGVEEVHIATLANHTKDMFEEAIKSANLSERQKVKARDHFFKTALETFNAGRSLEDFEAGFEKRKAVFMRNLEIKAKLDHTQLKTIGEMMKFHLMKIHAVGMKVPLAEIIDIREAKAA